MNESFDRIITALIQPSLIENPDVESIRTLLAPLGDIALPSEGTGSAQADKLYTLHGLKQLINQYDQLMQPQAEPSQPVRSIRQKRSRKKKATVVPDELNHCYEQIHRQYTEEWLSNNTASSSSGTIDNPVDLPGKFVLVNARKKNLQEQLTTLQQEEIQLQFADAEQRIETIVNELVKLGRNPFTPTLDAVKGQRQNITRCIDGYSRQWNTAKELINKLECIVTNQVLVKTLQDLQLKKNQVATYQSTTLNKSEIEEKIAFCEETIYGYALFLTPRAYASNHIVFQIIDDQLQADIYTKLSPHSTDFNHQKTLIPLADLNFSVSQCLDAISLRQMLPAFFQYTSAQQLTQHVIENDHRQALQDEYQHAPDKRSFLNGKWWELQAHTVVKAPIYKYQGIYDQIYESYTRDWNFQVALYDQKQLREARIDLDFEIEECQKRLSQLLENPASSNADAALQQEANLFLSEVDPVHVAVQDPEALWKRISEISNEIRELLEKTQQCAPLLQEMQKLIENRLRQQRTPNPLFALHQPALHPDKVKLLQHTQPLRQATIQQLTESIEQCTLFCNGYTQFNERQNARNSRVITVTNSSHTLEEPPAEQEREQRLLEIKEAIGNQLTLLSELVQQAESRSVEPNLTPIISETLPEPVPAEPSSISLDPTPPTAHSEPISDAYISLQEESGDATPELSNPTTVVTNDFSSPLTTWHQKISGRIPETLREWYSSLYQALETQAADLASQSQIIQLLHDIDFELDHTDPEQTLSAYRANCPSPELTCSALLTVKPPLPLCDLPLQPLPDVQLQNQIEQLYHHAETLQHRHAKDAALLRQATYNLHQYMLQPDRHQWNPESCLTDPRYKHISVHRNGGIYKLLEALAKFCTTILNLGKPAHQHSDYKQRFFFIPTQSAQLLEQCVHSVSLNMQAG